MSRICDCRTSATSGLMAADCCLTLSSKLASRSFSCLIWLCASSSLRKALACPTERHSPMSSSNEGFMPSYLGL